ncbi:flavin reductase family protein [Jejubacter calystegiae]|uniref:flavin reductase family protein n=1 Tax=Jejubacter calystegiae TaxID=2579935 RepID=UPI001F4FB853|nr:flavin reductase family protein [Jejubacter calystegiae]
MDADKRRQLRDAFGAFMTGVTVVTTVNKAQQPIGFTANSFSSVSLDPPLLLVSIDNRSANLSHFAEGERFAINILSEQQKEVSGRFARPGEDRFAATAWRRGEHGTPLIDGCSAWFECARWQTISAGDHQILIGEVLAFDSCGTAGLGYYRGAYFTPAQNAENLAAGPEVVVSALIEASGQAVMVKQQDGRYRLPSRSVAGGSVGESLEALLKELDVPANPGLVYSVYNDRQRNQQHIVLHCALPVGSTLNPPAQPGCEWVALPVIPDLPVQDFALKSLLNRFVRESAMGNYGLYYGDEQRGSIKQFAV